MKLIYLTLALLISAAAGAEGLAVGDAPASDGPQLAQVVPAEDPNPLQILQSQTRGVTRTFKIRNADNQEVEVKLTVVEANEETLPNRDIEVRVQLRCASTGIRVNYRTVFHNDGTCVFNQLGYNSVNNELVVQHTDPRMVRESGEKDFGRLRCDATRNIKIPLVCPAPPAGGPATGKRKG